MPYRLHAMFPLNSKYVLSISTSFSSKGAWMYLITVDNSMDVSAIFLGMSVYWEKILFWAEQV